MPNQKIITFLVCTLSFLLPMNTLSRMPSYSLFDYRGIPLDHLMINKMKFKKNGIFIEVGAHDGISQSNTKLLEEYFGWTGILIEPSENLFSILCKNRPNSKCFQCALGSFKENNTYGIGDFDGTLMASFTGRIQGSSNKKVLIRSLQSILDECEITHVNFFSLDTEGYELNILQGINFNKTTFDYLLIEIYTHQYQAITSLLSNNGYELVTCLSNYNKITNPRWDGTHNDYLFKRKRLIQ